MIFEEWWKDNKGVYVGFHDLAEKAWDAGCESTIHPVTDGFLKWWNKRHPNVYFNCVPRMEGQEAWEAGREYEKKEFAKGLIWLREIINDTIEFCQRKDEIK